MADEFNHHMMQGLRTFFLHSDVVLGHSGRAYMIHQTIFPASEAALVVPAVGHVSSESAVEATVVASGEGTGSQHHGLAVAALEDYEPLECTLDSLRAARELHRLMDRESAAARAVLLDEEKPAAVARRLGESVVRVYAQTARAMRNIRAALAPQTA